MKVATTCQITDELSGDAPAILRAISAELVSAVASAQNAHVIDALTAACNCARHQ